MPYIIKAIAKWYVRTVCSHRHSSGGNGSCMAPTVVNLFWALSICHWQCTTCSAPCKFKTKMCWSFPGSAPQRELLRCMGRREWSATSADWKDPRWKSRVTTLSASTRLSSNTSLAGVTAVRGIQQALVDHFASSRLELSAGFCPILFLSLSPSQNTYLSLYFSFLHPFSIINVCVVLLLKITKPVYKARLYPGALMNARARNLNAE